ncbi:hypothetical protein J5N97_006520 [Dioscorea zingiberensis]|uniref:WRKY domain-containing protein n=1 Tax=Dioscorea zingiberensis TaxID=325984 RepID=A0A9D5DBJ7_9LILI|nr:hypothetical protein J5N97_006520 [Dioscorea zingiberensis]
MAVEERALAGPRTYTSSFVNEELGLRSHFDHLSQNGNEVMLLKSKEKEILMNSKKKDIVTSDNPNTSLHDVNKPCLERILADRVAERSQFNAPWLDKAHVKSSSISDVLSPPLMILPGLSPTLWLDSPAFLSTSQEQVPTSIEDFSVQNQQVSYSAYASDRKDALVRRSSNSFISNEQSPFTENQPGQESDLQSDSSEAPPEDGYNWGKDKYNWRKYGEKQVKNSENPRRYYKCTHPNCTATKKVECTAEGCITKIIYRGVHKHSVPHPSRHTGVRSDWQFSDGHVNCSDYHGSKSSFDCQVDGQEATSSSARIATQYQNSSDLVGDESKLKRRIVETCATELKSTPRVMRKPKIVVQTISEVDVLDDGYRWRKYGQKVVKGNPNPRHNHDVPAAKNSRDWNHETSRMAANFLEALRLDPAYSLQNRMHFNASKSIDAFGRPETGISFFGEQGLANLRMARLDPIAPVKNINMPPQVHPVQGQWLPNEAGFLTLQVDQGEEHILEQPGYF